MDVEQEHISSSIFMDDLSLQLDEKTIRFARVQCGDDALLKVFAGFAQIALAAPLAIVGVVAIYGLEMLVAGIQAYVFTILTCVYLKDALHPHH